MMNEMFFFFFTSQKIIAVLSAVWRNYFQNHNSCRNRPTSVSHQAASVTQSQPRPSGMCGFVCPSFPPFWAPALHPDAQTWAQTAMSGRFPQPIFYDKKKNSVKLIMGDDSCNRRHCLSAGFSLFIFFGLPTAATASCSSRK